MARPCSTCRSEHKTEIERKLADGTRYLDIERWLKDMGPEHAGCSITHVSLSKHHHEHMVGAQPTQRPGKRPIHPDILQAIVEDAHEGLETGRLRATLRDATTAQRILDDRAARSDDRQLTLIIAQVLGGGYAAPAIDGQYIEVPLLEEGSTDGG